MSTISENFMNNLNNVLSFHGGGEGQDEDQGWNITVKVLSIVIILSITILFGFFPYFCNRCRKSVKILGLANAFSGGIFLGIALFHLLPEGIENIEAFFADQPDSLWKKIPLGYFLTFASYSLILFVEKVAFDSHSLIEHDHGDHAHGHGEHNHVHEQEELKSQKAAKGLKENLLKKNEEDSESEDSDLEEEVLKNVVSSRGKFASFLQQRNSMVERQTQSYLERQSPPKRDRALSKASVLLQKTLNKDYRYEENEDMQYMVNPENVHVEDKEKLSSHHEHEEVFVPKSNLTPFLLLIALSLHGFFEGIALGIQGEVKDTVFLFVAIIAHKWAEAFTLGISFTKANTPKNTFIALVCIFAAFTPLGIGLGLILSGSSKLIEGVTLAISTGTFIYVAASEVIVEEFAVTKYRFSKFLLYLVGGIFVGFLAVIEKVYGDEEHDHGL